MLPRVLGDPFRALGLLGGGGGAIAPVNTVAPVISGTLNVGQTLSVTDGTWTGTAPIVYTYQWKRAGVNIALATNSTYLLVSADKGTSITCEVTATNAAGNASATSAAVVINMVLTPDFATDTNWTKGTNWAITGGQAVATVAPSGGAGNLSQDIGITAAVSYSITFTISGYSSGTVRVLCNNVTPGTSRSANGTFNETLVAGAGNSLFYIQVTVNFTGNIDDVRVVPN